jgi:hypothetical protein
LWDEFNTCWLALFQKQKDTTLAMLETGAQLDNVLDETVLKKMAKELIRLCDKMEQHGLVDYQMGVWEEEILCGECHPEPRAVPLGSGGTAQGVVSNPAVGGLYRGIY